MPSYGRKAKAGFIWGVIGRSTTELVAIPAAMVVARLVTPYDFGVMALANFFVQIAQRLTNFGFNMALVRLKDPTDLHASSVFVVNLVTGFGVWLVLSASAGWFGSFFNSPEAAEVIPVATLTFIIGSFGVVPSALLARELRFKELSLIDSSNAWVQAIVGVALAWQGFGYWSLVYAQLAASTAPTCLKFLVSRWRPSLRFSRTAIGDVLSLGIGLHFKRLLDTAALNIDNLVIGRVLGVAPLGIYDKAFTTMNRGLTFLSSAGLLVSSSVFSRLQDEPARLRESYRKVAMATALLGHPLFAALIVTAEPLFLVLFGPQWGEAVLPFRILCGAAVFRLQGVYIGAAVESVGNVWKVVWLQAMFVVLLVTGVVLSRPWGLPGAATAVLLATVTVTVSMAAQLRRVVPLTWADMVTPQIPAITCSVCLTTAILAVDAALTSVAGPLPALLRLMLLGLAGAAGYVAFLLFSPFPAVRNLVSETVAEFAPRFSPVLRRLGLASTAPFADDLSR